MNLLLRSFVTATFLAVLQYRDAESFSCYQCASKGLQYQWQVTGLQLPTTLQTAGNFFNDTCNTLTATEVTALTSDTSCEDFCFAMMITLLNEDGSKNVGASYWVRGCHYKFTGFKYTLSGTLPTQGKCEYGTITRYTNNTDAVLTPASYGWCNQDVAGATQGTTVPCNGALKYDGQSNCQVTPNKINCYDCVEGSTTRPCSSVNTNQGAYCYKSDLWINYQHFVTRSISDINPLAPGTSGAQNLQAQSQPPESKCGKVSVTNIVPSRAYATYSGYDCYCNNNVNYCNGAFEVTAFGMMTTVLAMVACVIAKL